MQNIANIQEKNFYNKNGYLIFNINKTELIDKVNQDVKKIIKEKKYKTNTKIYSYNNSPRIVESFKLSNNCCKLAKIKIVRDKIQNLYKEKPYPFSTINFIKSTQQPLHSDYSHFGTIPKLKLVGSWIALQDIDENSGPLHVVPGSHKMGIYNFFDYTKKMPTSLNDVKKNYSKYEKWIKKEMKKKNLKSIVPKMKKGDCILWDANLLHGSPKCNNNRLLRRSQVTHWSFKSVKKHYNPSFSNPKKSIFKLREVNFF